MEGSEIANSLVESEEDFNPTDTKKDKGSIIEGQEIEESNSLLEEVSSYSSINMNQNMFFTLPVHNLSLTFYDFVKRENSEEINKQSSTETNLDALLNK